MGKRKYRSVRVKDVVLETLGAAVGTGGCTVGIDVAKEKFFASFMDTSQQVCLTVRWNHPEETGSFVQLAAGLVRYGPVAAVMEPTGVYGDALRGQLIGAGLAVYRVSTKRSHDMAEVYDGVWSWHDAKSAAIIAKLHLDGASEAWPITSPQQRAVAAALRVLDMHHQEFLRNRNRLEGLLSRYWPEMLGVFDSDSVTLLELLMAYGGPASIAASPPAAAQLMRRVGGVQLSGEKIAAVLDSVERTIGLPQVPEEVHLVKAVAAECRRQQLASRAARRRVEELTETIESTRRMAETVGKTTAAILTASVGEATTYRSAAAFEKSLGLNLREKSSGKQQGLLHVTKRGPGIARKYLFMATLRLLKDDPIVRAWFAKKVQRDGGRKLKALVAVMRKLARALWHVAHGSDFDSKKLFDSRRLRLNQTAQNAQEVPAM